MGSVEQTEGARGKKMYVTLLLLITPAFGMPGNPLIEVGEEIINQLDSLVDFNEETKSIFGNFNFEEISDSLSEAEENIRKIEIELKNFESEELKFEDNYFQAYKAKRYLRETRQGLRKLADKTVREVRDLKLVLEVLDETDDTFLLKFAIERMKDLMIRTLETLKEALEKYNLALDSFEKLNSSIKTQNRKLEKLVDKDSAEYTAWTKKLRSSVFFPGIGAFPKGCVIADIFVTLGWCSAAEIKYVPFRGSIEVLISQYSEEIEKLATITGTMLYTGKTIDQKLIDAIDFLTIEIEFINNWTNSAEFVKKNIDKYPQEYLKKYISIRTIFMNGLDDLKNAAETFFAQPREIFGKKYT